MLLCVSFGPTRYIFHTSMARYSLFVLKVPLKLTKQTNIGHFGDKSFQSITCSGTDNLTIKRQNTQNNTT